MHHWFNLQRNLGTIKFSIYNIMFMKISAADKYCFNFNNFNSLWYKANTFNYALLTILAGQMSIY